MKKCDKSLLLICLLGMNGFLLAQSELTGFGPGGGDMPALRNRLEYMLRELKKEDGGGNGLEVVGSPYVDSVFVDSQLYKEDMVIPHVPVRYNAFADQLEMHMEDTDGAYKVYVVSKDPSVSCVRKGEHYVYADYEEDGASGSGYLIKMLESGYFIPYKKVFVYYREGRKARTSLEGDIPNKYVMKEELFIGIGTEKPVSLRLKEKYVLGMMEKPHRKLAEELLEQEKFNLKKEEDLLRFLDRLNKELDLLQVSR